jgi:hypothetical protein
MLARRFTIIALMMTLFAMLFSLLVAEAGRSPRSWHHGVVVSCPSEEGLRCILSDTL